MCGKALKYKNLGYDAGLIDMGDHFYIGQFLEPYCNFRTDEYGGVFENRMRFGLRVVKKLRERLGDDFILVGNMPGTNGIPRGPMIGLTEAESAQFLKAIEPYVDIALIREPDVEMSLAPRESETIPCAKKMKEAGVKIRIACATPYMDLKKIDAAITSGACDIIMSGRMFICNENLGEILKNGETDDVNPCIECGVCRGTSAERDWMSHCTINPRLGMEHRVDKLIQPVAGKKRVAIVGAGPGGVKCALWLKERGHTPVIYEKTGGVGGPLKHAYMKNFKWKMARYLDFLLHQLEKNEIEVHWETEATPAIIESGGFDVVVAAVGAKPKKPPIEGIEYAEWDVCNIYGRPDEIGRTVVVIGGSSSPSEAAIYLRQLGHRVIQLNRKGIICYDLNPIHQRAYFNIIAQDVGVETIHHARTTKLGPGKVYYSDAENAEHCIECDDILAAGGMEPNNEEAMRFYGITPEFYMIGDCRNVGAMRTAIRDAYMLAMRI
jgi:thioredoxin reductase